MVKDFAYWRRQIESAKHEHKDWWKQCDNLGKLYTDKDTRINVLYSNTQVLKSALLNNNPRPEISRRFYNSMEADKHKSDLYSITSRVAAAAVEYYFAKNNTLVQLKDGVSKNLIYGREVIWTDYVPTIVQVPDKQSFLNKIGTALHLTEPQMTEKIAGRDIKITALKPREYLCSYAQSEDDVWWRARRHLLSAHQLQERFGYEASDEELEFCEQEAVTDYQTPQTRQKRGEVWEIWDKEARKRIFILLTSKQDGLLEENLDPYKLSEFWPCWVNSFLQSEDNIMPVPEYMIYSKLANEINDLADKNAVLESKVKYVKICNNKDQSFVEAIETADDGEIVANSDFNSATSSNSVMEVVDVKGAIELIAENERRITVLQQKIWEITGLSDLMRGATDARETAAAQKIKGFYGGLRFRDRQMAQQDGIRSIFRIVSELICEHWDWDTLSQISSVDILSENQKKLLVLQIQSGAITADDALQEKIQAPTSDEVIGLLRNDRMRNFLIDIESTATEFDDKAAQTEQIQKLTDVYLTAIQTANKLSTPEYLDGFVALVKMNLSSIKISNAIANQLVDSLTRTANKMREAQKQSPQPTIEDKKLHLDSQKILTDKEIKLQKMQQDAMFKERELALREREVAAKEHEIAAETAANAIRIKNGITPDTNLG